MRACVCVCVCVGAQPTVGEFDINQLHENTYYNVCVKVFSSQLFVNDDYNNLDRQHPGSIDVWNNYEGSAAGLGDSQLYHQSAAGSDVQLRDTMQCTSL